MKARGKIKKAFGAVLLAAIVIALAAFIFARVQKKGENKPTFLFGRALFWVETESMEPTIKARSFILVKRSDGKDLKEGDVITFICTDETSAVYGRLVTHRIVEKAENGYKTKGDNPSAIIDPWTVSKENVVGVYAKNLTVMTVIGRVFTSGAGLAIIVAAFLFSFGFIFIPDVIAVIKEEKSEDKEKIIADRVEREVERMIKENGGEKDEKKVR